MTTASASEERAAGLHLTWFLDVPEFRKAFGLILVFSLSSFLLLPLLTLLLWAFTDEWRYPSVLPQSFSLRWWDWVLSNGDVGTAVRYSFITAPVVTLLAAVVCLPAAYAFSRFRFRGHRGLAQWILSMRFMPPVAIAIPVYLLMNDLHLLDTYWGLIIPYTGFSLPLVVWLMIGFFDEVPTELDDGALIDGCSRLSTLLRVVLPLTAPGLAATAIFSVIFTWNEFLVGLFIVSTQASETIPIGAAGLISAERPIQWNVAATVGVVTVIPVLFFAFFVQKYIARGFTTGAVK